MMPQPPGSGSFRTSSTPTIPQRRYHTFQHQPVASSNTTPFPADMADSRSRAPRSHQSDTDNGLGTGASPRTHRNNRRHLKSISLPSMSTNTQEPFTIRGQLSAQAKPFNPTLVTPSPEPLRRPYSSHTPRSEHHPFFPMLPRYSQDNHSLLNSRHAPFHFEPSHNSHFQQAEPNHGLAPPAFDPYGSSTGSLSTGPHTPHQPQINPYAQDSSTTGGTSYFQDSSYTQPLQYHLYTALGPHREAMHPHQRNARDFFLSDTLREELQRKSAAAHQILPRELSGYHPGPKI